MIPVPGQVRKAFSVIISVRTLFFWLVIAATLLSVTFFFYMISPLVALVFEDCRQYAISSEEIQNYESQPQQIPKILHQTWKNETVPTVWKGTQESCIKKNSEFEYRLWTDADGREFIEKNYAWFLETYDSYPYNIQRADVIRYFILSHYGGVYLDLDDGCQKNLSPLLQFQFWLRQTTPTGISNDAIGSIPQHPFLLSVIKSLQAAKRNWGFPYITVMATTGPLFLSVTWQQYIASQQELALERQSRIRVLMLPDYKGSNSSFFYIVKGNSWHAGDSALFTDKNLWFAIILVFVILVALKVVCCSAKKSKVQSSTRFQENNIV